MGRKGWTTISLPNELYHELRRHVPTKARSVQEYVRHWARIGSLIDDLRAKNESVEGLATRVDQALRDLKIRRR
jgi:hypothetical protein